MKLNSAAIIREEHLIDKKEKKEAKILKDLEMNLRDDSEYNRWIESNKTKSENAEFEKK